MWKIGDLEVDGKVVLGPMSGFTSSGYRDFMKPFGVAVSVTEMTSDVGVLHGHRRTAEYLAFGRNYPTGLQLFGNDPDVLAQAAAAALRINPNIDFFDLNMGCPTAKVIRGGNGSALLKDPRKCGEIVRRIKAAVEVPVTAKIRLGWSAGTVNFRQVIAELTAAGADAIALHVRTKEERYCGQPHYELVEGLQAEMAVPLVISGNIYSAADAAKAVGVTGAAGVMVARGGIGNPFLITQIDRYFRTGEVLPNPTVDQQVDWGLELADFLVREKDEATAVRRLRSIAPRFIAGCHWCHEYRKRLASEPTDLAGFTALMEEIRDEMGAERIYTGGRAVPEDGPPSVRTAFGGAQN